MHLGRSALRTAFSVILTIAMAAGAHSYTNDENSMGPGKQAGPHSKINRLALQRFIVEFASKDPVLSRYDFLPSATAYGLDAGKTPLFEVESDACVTAGDWYKDQAVPVASKLPFATRCTCEDGRVRQSFAWWIYEGGYSADEPEFYMSLRHFYDPSQKSKNADGQLVSYLTDDLNGYLSPFFMGYNPAMNAKQWALTDSPYSIDQCEKSLDKAYGAAPAIQAKQLHFGAAWRSIGEAMHLLADMTVPAHTRNDSHPDKAGRWSEDIINLKGDPYEKYVTAKVVYEWAKDGYYDDAFAKKIANAKDPDALFELVAENTNHNYFSLDTISGIDAVTKEPVHSFNGQPDYDSPKLQNYKFTETDKHDGSGFYADKYGIEAVFRRSDGKYSMEPVVATQAKRLIPIAITADAKLIDLCMPRIGVSVSGLDPKNKSLKCGLYDYSATGSGYKRSPSARYASSWDHVVLFVGESAAQGTSSSAAASQASPEASPKDDLNKKLTDLKDTLKDLGSVFKRKKKTAPETTSAAASTQPADDAKPDTDGMKAYWIAAATPSPSALGVSLPKEVVDKMAAMLTDEKPSPGASIRMIVGMDMGGVLVKSRAFSVYPISVTLSESGTDCKVEVVGSNTAGARYEWDFGDGSPVEKTDQPVSSHHYAKDGQFLISARIFGKDSEDPCGQAIGKIGLKAESEAPAPQVEDRPATVIVGKADNRTLDELILDNCLIGFEGNSTPEILAKLTSKSRFGFSYFREFEGSYGESGDSRRIGWCKTIVDKGVLHRREDENGVYSEKATHAVEYPYMAWYEAKPVGCDFYRSPYSAYCSVDELNADPGAGGVYESAKQKLDRAVSGMSGDKGSACFGDAGAAGSNWCCAIRGPMFAGLQVTAKFAFYRPGNNSQKGQWYSFNSLESLKMSTQPSNGWTDSESVWSSYGQWNQQCGKVAADVVAGELGAFEQWCNSKISTGDGIRGYYTPNAWRYALTPSEIGNGFELGKEERRKPWEDSRDNKSGYTVNYCKYSGSRYTERYLVSMTIEDLRSGMPALEASVPRYEGWLKEMKRPAKIDISGVDASAQMVSRNVGENLQRIIFRKGNVCVEIKGFQPGLKKQAPTPNAERIARLIAAKLNAVK